MIENYKGKKKKTLNKSQNMYRNLNSTIYKSHDTFWYFQKVFNLAK